MILGHGLFECVAIPYVLDKIVHLRRLSWRQRLASVEKRNRVPSKSRLPVSHAITFGRTLKRVDDVITTLYQVSESLTPEADSRIGIYLIHHGKQLLGEFAMSTPVPLRSDFDTIGLRMLARRSRDPDQTRRLLALAEIYDGGSRPDAARIGGVGVQIVRDWVVRFNAKGPDGLLTGKAPGAPSILGERQRQALRQVVEDGPIPALHGVVRWRLIDLAQWLFEEFRVSISKPTLSRELRHMGFRKLSARPRHHAQDEEAAAAFKKTFSPSWRRPPQKRLLASR